MEYTVNNRWDRVYDPRSIIRIIERHNSAHHPPVDRPVGDVPDAVLQPRGPHVLEQVGQSFISMAEGNSLQAVERTRNLVGRQVGQGDQLPQEVP